jgi:hypothetical protein
VTTFGVQRQSNLGYSATSVQAKDLIVAKPISVANGLTGKVAGLQSILPTMDYLHQRVLHYVVTGH